MKYLLPCFIALFVISACTPSQQIKVPNIGEPVPNISWTTIYGEKIDLNQFKGKWVLLCYWCPCPRHQVDISAIKSLYNDVWHGQIEVLVIDAPNSLQSGKTLEEFADVNLLPLDFKLIPYKQDDITNNFSRPQYFLINPSGILYKSRANAFSSDILPYLVSRDYTGDINERKTLANAIEFTSDAIINISNVKISNITDKSAELYWKTDVEANSIAYLSAINISGLGVTKLYRDVNLTKSHTINLNNLEPSKWYSVDLKSEGVNESYDTYDLGFNTQPSDYADRAKIFNIYISDITDTSANIRWSTDRPVSCSVCCTTYCTALDEPTVDHSYTFSKRKPTTEYWAQLMAVDRGVSDVFNFKTLKAIDSTPNIP